MRPTRNREREMKKLFFTIVALSLLAGLSTITAENNDKVLIPCQDESLILNFDVTASRYIKRDTYACTSKEAYDEMIRACVDDDMDHLKRMVLRGTLVVLTKGTRIDVIKRVSLGVYKVQVLSGPYVDAYLFVDVESISN